MTGHRVFRALLVLYPRAFRARYGPDMLAAFLQASRELRHTHRVRFWLAMLRDFIVTVPRAWRDVLLTPRRRPPPSRKANTELMYNLLKDLRYALRGLRRKPGMASISITALALGIGLTTAMFSVVNGVVLKGLPVDEPHEVMAINRINPSEGQSRLIGRYHDFLDLRERQATFDDIGAMTITPMNVSPPGGVPEFVSGTAATANMFSLLGTSPIMGRGLVPEDEVVGAPKVVVIGDRLWHDRFNADPNVLGQSIRVNGAPATVVGVMPEGFEFPVNQQIWEPLRVEAGTLERGAGPSVFMFGRLKDGVTVTQASSDLSGIMRQLGTEFPDTNEGMDVVVGLYVRELIGYQVTPLLFTMLAAVALVLLIACANVANLLLARASTRSKEVAVRAALGASRGRVVRQLMMESSVIAIFGGVAGLGIAQIGVDLFNRALQAQPQGLPFWFAIEIDPTVARFVLLLTIGASILSGIIPAVRASRQDVQSVLKDEARGSSGLRIGRISRALVVMEVAFSCALLVAAGLMIKSVTNLSNVDHEFATENMLIAGVSLPESEYPSDAQRNQFFRDLVDRMDGQAGVEATAVTTDVPVIGFGNGRFELEGETYEGDRDYPSARLGSVSPEYFRTLEVSLLEGRDFTRLDNATALPVAIVNRAFASKYFPSEPAIGKRLSIHAALQQGARARGDEKWYTIVGVAPDMYLDADVFILASEAIYIPFPQRPTSAANIMVRTEADPLQMTSRLREVVADMDGNLPISQVNALDQAIRDQNWFITLFGIIFSIFGGVALFLATIGLYGVLSFTVAQRTHEVGLRVALGATPGRVVRLMMRQGLAQLAIGMGVGLTLAIVLGRMIGILLYDVGAADPPVLLGIFGVLFATGVLACFVPARRATRVDPMIAMRAE